MDGEDSSAGADHAQDHALLNDDPTEEGNTDSVSEMMEESADVAHHRTLFGTSAVVEPNLGEGAPTADSSPIASSDLASLFATTASGALNEPPPPPMTVVSDSVFDEIKREKVQIAQELFVLSEQHSALQTKSCKLGETVEAQQAELEALTKDRSQRMCVMRELEAERDMLMLSKNEFEQKAELLSHQKQDYESRVDRLNHDKCLIAADVESLKNEIEKLSGKNCLLQTQVDEVGKDKRMFQFEKECWAQEKEIYLRNRDWFTGEIKDRDSKLTMLRIESARLTGELEAEKATLSDELDASKEILSKSKAQISARQEQIEKLNERIKEVLDDRASRMSKMEEELVAAERLISVYKEASEDAEGQLSQLHTRFDDHQKLVDETKEAYDSIRSQMELQQSAQDAQIAMREEKIAELKDEIIKANDLLKSKHRLSLTDDEITALSPSAAAACSLIRSGVSLTGIYREHCRVVAELEAAKNENATMEAHFRELVEEIEDKAPVLAQQRAEHERVSELCSRLRNQLEGADEERQRMVSAKDAATRELAYTKAELERYQRDNEDMARQIRHLLHAYEVNKASMGRDTDSPPLSVDDREDLWCSIGELQKVNQKLMSDLRAAQTNNQKAVDEANNSEIERLSEALGEATKKLYTMKDYSDKQDVVIDKLKDQRDSYRRVADERRTQEESATISRELSEAHVQMAQLKTQAERSESMLNVYRDEKLQAEKIWTDRIDQQIALISGLRKTNGKLEADIELQKQTQEILKKQAESDEQELANMQEKNSKLSGDLKVLGERLHNTQEELITSRGEIAKFKTDVNALRDEVTLLRSTNARITQEIQVVRESSYSNEKMSLAIQHMQSRLDRTDSDKLKQMEDQLTISRNENENLKKFVTEITEQHRIISLDLKMSSNKVTSERDQSLASKKSAEDRLTWKEGELTQLQAKYDELIRQVNAPDSVAETTVEGYKKDAQQLRNKNNYLENQLKDLRAKLEAGEKKLSVREKELENFTKVSGNLETTLVEQSALSAAERRSLQSMLDLANQQLETSTAKVSELRGEVFKLEQRVSEEAMKCEQFKLNAQKEVSEVEKKLTSAEAVRVNAETRISELNAQLDAMKKSNKTLSDEQIKAKELLSKMDDEVRYAHNKMTLAENAVQSEVKLDEAHKATAGEVAVLRLDKKKLEEELGEAHELNKQQTQKVEVLNEQLMKLSERVAFLEKTNDPEMATSGGAPARSANALYDVIKYLQLEHEQEAERTMNAEIQWKRLQAQQSAVEERSTKLQHEVTALRSKAEESVRAIAEKSEMVSRLTLLQGVQKENADLKAQIHKNVASVESLSKMLGELKTRMAALEAEKVSEKSKLQNATTDLQNARRESEAWRLRHAQAMVALDKCGPQRILNLTSEVENLKRKLTAMTHERDVAKQEMRKATDEVDTSGPSGANADSLRSQLAEMTKQRNETSSKFEQIRSLARQYRLKSQTLEKEQTDLKAQLAAKSTDQTGKEEVNKLKEQLQASQNETEQLKQKMMQSTRTGWPVEQQQSSSTAANTRANALLQSQMKQIETLNQQNKELSKNMEGLANQLKQSQTKLEESNAAKTAEVESKEELNFRLSSITSMANKRDEELKTMREEALAKIKQAQELDVKVKALEMELNECKTQLSEQENTAKSSASTSNVTVSATVLPKEAVVKPVSSSTAPAPQTGTTQSTSSTRIFGSSTGTSVLAHASAGGTVTPSGPAAALSGTVVGSAPGGVPVTSPFSFPTPSSASAVPTKPSLFATSLQKTDTTLLKSGTSVSTTSEQSSAVASSSEKKGVVGLLGSGSVPGAGTVSGAQTFSFSGPPRTTATPFSSSMAQVKFGSSNPFKSTFTTSTINTTTTFSALSTANQSNTVSQSTPSPSAITTSGQQHKPAQQNVISGSGDGTNVISSSGSAHSASITVPTITPTSSVPQPGTTAPRKRSANQNSDQSSSVETGSDVQDPIKRQRASPTEQVSTSGRFLQSSSELTTKLVVPDEDEAEQEQQESVETTTNPEDEGVGEDFLADDIDALDQPSSEGGLMIGEEDIGAEQHEEEEEDQGENDEQDVENEHSDDEILLVDEEQGDEMDDTFDTLNEGGEQENQMEAYAEEVSESQSIAHEDTMSDENDTDDTDGSDIVTIVASHPSQFEGEEDYEDEMEDEQEDIDEDEFEETDDEEVSESQSNERFAAHHQARIRRPLAVPPMRAVHQGNVDDDSDDVIVIEDDDEGEEGEGAVEFSHSPAEQSMDEADEGVGRVIRLLDVDTSLDEPHRAERENDDHEGRMLQSHDVGEARDTTDHLELQQAAPGSRLDSSSQQQHLATHIETHSDGSASALQVTKSETYSDNGEMELSQSLDNAAHAAEAGDVVSASGMQVSRDSSPFVVNIESDSRGASSTVVAMAGGGEGLGGRSEVAVDGLLMRGGDQEEDLETGNEVADEEHAAKRGAQQTDDEGTTEPSTSDSSMPHRRIRIRFPDIDEPSSSSNDGPQGAATRGHPLMRGARGRGVRRRTSRGRFFH